MKVRLNKYISECGIDSRRKVEELILQGRVYINQQLADNLAIKIDPELDSVALDGEILKKQKRVYYLLNKPKGYVTTTSDEKKRKTVLDLINSKIKIFPVGRLDFNTTGVLILTNDGDFANFLLHPRNSIPRIYEVLLDKPITDKDVNKLLKGLYLDNRISKFEKIKILNYKSKKILSVTTVEGRNHFVKNMFNTVGYGVKELCRTKFAEFNIDSIYVGKWRNITEDEIKNIYMQYGKN